jgi:hypothetical protein
MAQESKKRTVRYRPFYAHQDVRRAQRLLSAKIRAETQIVKLNEGYALVYKVVEGWIVVHPIKDGCHDKSLVPARSIGGARKFLNGEEIPEGDRITDEERRRRKLTMAIFGAVI